MLLLVRRHLEDHAAGQRQAPEPLRRDLPWPAARLDAALSNTSRRVAKNSVGSARSADRASASDDTPSVRPAELDDLAVDAVDLVVAGAVELRRVDVERRVHPDEVVVALLAAGNRHMPGSPSGRAAGRISSTSASWRRMNAGRIVASTAQCNSLVKRDFSASDHPSTSSSVEIGSSSGQRSIGASRTSSRTVIVRRTGDTLATRPSARLARRVSSCRSV